VSFFVHPEVMRSMTKAMKEKYRKLIFFRIVKGITG